MTQIPTINEMADLKNYRFGRPWPRHGLKLLYWFAKDYVDFDDDNQMVANYDPQRGKFGFHDFQNRKDNCDNYGCKTLLPDEEYPFFEVGNLNSVNYPSSDSLPDYVKEDYDSNLLNSNTDRIIISVRKNNTIEKVYVTQHEDMKKFDPKHTYRISRGLLMIIQNHSLQWFLEEVGYEARPKGTRPQGSHVQTNERAAPHTKKDVKIYMPDVPRANQGSWWSMCTIL